MYEKKIPEDLDCGLVITMKVLGGKWKPCIIDAINRNIRRPSAIHAAIPGTAPRVLNMQLRELEESGIVSKKVFPGLPLRVEYYLTETGESLLPLISAIEKWGLKNKEFVVKMAGALETEKEV